MVKKVISKRVDTNLKAKKTPTKSELELQIKHLIETNDALEESLKKKTELLEGFEQKICNLEYQIDYLSSKDIMFDKETQTEVCLKTKCEECNFEGETERELRWHLGKYHGWPGDVNSDGMEDMDVSSSSQGVRYCVICDYEAEDMYDLEAHTWSEHEEVSIVDHTRRTFKVIEKVEEPSVHQNVLSCEFCESNFESLGDLMKHKKDQHTEKVNICWNYVSSNCEFGDDRCWFLHTNETKEKFNCTLCGKTFRVQAKLLEHRRKFHINSVKTCKNLSSGTCKYGKLRCWFIHNEFEEAETNENKKSENEEVIERIFKLMEKLTHQMVDMKEKNNLK